MSFRNRRSPDPVPGPSSLSPAAVRATARRSFRFWNRPWVIGLLFVLGVLTVVAAAIVAAERQSEVLRYVTVVLAAALVTGVSQWNRARR